MTKQYEKVQTGTKLDVYRLLNLNRDLSFSFFRNKKLLIQAKWYPMALVSLTEKRREVIANDKMTYWRGMLWR